MTHRRLAVLAVLAAATAVIAGLVSPFLHHDRAAHTTPVTDQRRPAPPAVSETAAVATIAARRALACQPPGARAGRASGDGSRGWCGRFTLTRRQSSCTTSSRCQVELIGRFATPDTTTIIALTVTVQRNDAGGWRAVAVSS
jgi:hypothetical protein